MLKNKPLITFFFGKQRKKWFNLRKQNKHFFFFTFMKYKNSISANWQINLTPTPAALVFFVSVWTKGSQMCAQTV